MANAPEKHARLSGSSAHRWVVCPGSVRMSQYYPDRTSKFAKEGTAAHELAAWCLNQNKDAKAFLGEYTSNRYEVTKDMANNVQRYVDTVRDYAIGATLLVEQPLPIDFLTGEEDAESTGDAVIISTDGEEIQIHDLKYGMGERVYAEDNLQLAMYALGAMHKYSMCGDFKRVKLVIHQPRLNVFDEWDVSAEELEQIGSKIKAAADNVHAIDLSLDEEDHLNPGEKQCRWCKAKADCPALNKFVRVAIVSEDELLDLAADGSAEDIQSEIDTLKQGIYTNERLGRLMSVTGLVEQWLKAVRSAVEVKLFEGQEVPGYKLVAGKQGNRQWRDAEEAEQTMKALRLKVDEMYSKTIISPTQAEKLLAKEQPKRWAKLEEIITRKDGSPSVAPVSDKRPALVLAVDGTQLAALAADGEDAIA